MKRLLIIVSCINCFLATVAGQETTVKEQQVTGQQPVTELSASAQSQTKSGTLLFFYRLGRTIETALMKGIDSTYLELYDRSWRFALTATGNGVYNTINMSDMPSNSNVNIDLRSSPSIGLGFSAAWHSIQFNYSWDVMFRRSRKFDFAILNRAWGIEFTHHVNTNIYGRLDVQNDMTYDINYGDLEIATTFLSMYFIFNSDEYSTSSALRQSYRQKKSAGSFYLQAQYLGTNITSTGDPLTYTMNSLKSTEIHQAAVSAGYGYNYTPNNGKFLLHISAAPMAIVFNRTILTFYYPLTIDNEKFDITLQQVIDPKHWLYITGTARVAFSWDINEWCYFAGNAQFYNMRFNSKKTETLALKINTWEWNANITFGARFGISRKKMKTILEQYDEDRKNNPRKDDILDWVDKKISKH